MRWHGKEFERLLDEQIVRGLTAAAAELHRISRKKAGIINPGRTVPITRPRAGGNATQRTIYTNSSKPGESPRRRTGFGQKNIVFGVNPAVKAARVGYTANARYMTFHELGIRYSSGFQQRPTLVPALRDNLPRLREIFQRASARGRGRR